MFWWALLLQGDLLSSRQQKQNTISLTTSSGFSLDRTTRCWPARGSNVLVVISMRTGTFCFTPVWLIREEFINMGVLNKRIDEWMDENTLVPDLLWDFKYFLLLGDQFPFGSVA